MIRLLDHRTLVEALWAILDALDPVREWPSCRPGCWAQDADAVMYGMAFDVGESVAQSDEA